MGPYQYWMLAEFIPYAGNSLELSSAQLWSGGARVDSQCSLSSPQSPDLGSLSDLSTGSLSSSVKFLRGNYPRLIFNAGTGNSLSVDEVRLGSTATKGVFPLSFSLYGSNDGNSWELCSSPYGVTYPGAFSLTTSAAIGTPGPLDIFYLDTSGPIGSSTLADKCGSTLVESHGVIVSSTLVSGANGYNLYGNGCWASFAPSNPLLSPYGSGPFKLSSTFYMSSFSGTTFFFGNEHGLPTGWIVKLDQATPTPILRVYWDGDSVHRSWAFPLPSTISLNTLHYLEFGRGKDGVVRVFLDGVPSSTTFSDSTPLIGAHDAAMGGNFFIGGYGTNYGTPGSFVFLELSLSLEPVHSAPYTPAMMSSFSKSIIPCSFSGEVTYAGGSPLVSGNATLLTLPGPGEGPHPSVSSLPLFAQDVYYGGLGVISGNVLVAGSPNSPVIRRVSLYSERDRVWVRDTWSAADGTYSFTGLRKDLPFTLIGYDYTGAYVATISDNQYAV